ncbi:MAG: GDSL family lipase [Planctomycetes bacterium]|nr:GDSL family lipase [Planctomycetota bacterium]
MIFVGDSITQGWEGEGKAVWKERFAPRNAVNFGIGGDRTQHVLYRVSTGNLDGLDSPATGNSPRLVILMIGTNNTAGGPGVANSAQQINQGIRADVRAIHDKLPRADILVLGIFPRSEKPDAARELIVETNKLVSNIGQGIDGEPPMPRVRYLDISDKFLEKNGTISKEIMPDFLHLSEKGYRIWADAIAAEVDRSAPVRGK